MIKYAIAMAFELTILVFAVIAIREVYTGELKPEKWHCYLLFGTMVLSCLSDFCKYLLKYLIQRKLA